MHSTTLTNPLTDGIQTRIWINIYMWYQIILFIVGKIQLIVAIPPVEVSMKMGEKFITGPIKINLEEQKKASNISCVATGKVIIDKSRVEVSLLEQDTVENVS